MKESLNFYYDGVYSVDMNIYNVNSSSGLFEEFFLPTREIHEQKSFGRDKPYFIETTRKPLSFNLRLYIDKDVIEEKMQVIKRWLFQDYYKPLIFSYNPNKIYYAMIHDNSTLTHNGIDSGYVDINVRCDSPYVYTPEYFEENVLNKTKKVVKEIAVDESNFSEGLMNGLGLNLEGNLELNEILIWGQIPENTKWGEIV